MKGGEKMNIAGLLSALPAPPVIEEKDLFTNEGKKSFPFQMILEEKTEQNTEAELLEKDESSEVDNKEFDSFITKIADMAQEMLTDSEENKEKLEKTTDIFTESEIQQKISDQYDHLEEMNQKAEQLLSKLKTNQADQETLSQVDELLTRKTEIETEITVHTIELAQREGSEFKNQQLPESIESVLQGVFLVKTTESDESISNDQQAQEKGKNVWSEINDIVARNGKTVQNENKSFVNQNDKPMNPLINQFNPIPVELPRNDAEFKQRQNPVHSVMQQMQDVYQKAEQVFTNITDNQKLPKVSSEMLQLLKQWTSMEKQLPGAQSTAVRNPKDSAFDSIWKGLVTAFKNQEQFVTRMPYNVETEVTVTDVSRWLGNVWNTSVEKTVPQSGIPAAMPMSRLEQYMIHLQQNQSPQLTQQSFNQQIESLIQSSRFLTQPTGQNVLSITLNPSNLGEMLVRMTEVDGEMLVKIIVTTPKAKEMLESNMQQLRHMFSPHQVQIERHEGQLNMAQTTEDKENLSEEEREEQQEQPEQEQNSEQPEREFSDYFRNTLLNEEV